MLELKDFKPQKKSFKMYLKEEEYMESFNTKVTENQSRLEEHGPCIMGDFQQQDKSDWTTIIVELLDIQLRTILLWVQKGHSEIPDKKKNPSTREQCKDK